MSTYRYLSPLAFIVAALALSFAIPASAGAVPAMIRGSWGPKATARNGVSVCSRAFWQ